MIDPHETDAGRRVVYSPPHGAVECGTVKGWNDLYVFVLYDGDTTPKATRRCDLNWLH